MKERNDKMKRALAISVAAMVMMSSSLAYANSNNNNKAVDKKAEKVEQQIEKANQKLEKAEEKVARLTELKEAAKSQYTTEEIEKVNKASDALKKEDKSLKVLPFNNIVSKNKHFKFDTPPVIKGGRTLIPVRAITEGLGAEVKWNAETREVTISKGDITIVITIDSNVVLVNGEEVTIDAKAELLTSRTYVPLRFIAETLGLKVTWDEETETIEIDEDTEIEEQEDETNGTGETETEETTVTTETNEKSETEASEDSTSTEVEETTQE